MKSLDRTKASFAVVGVSRSGTQSLGHCLTRHPLIELCDQDKSGYFAKDKYFELGTPCPLLYEPKDSMNRENVIWGDICPDYVFKSQSIARLCHYNPGIKLITILRNPAERAYSHWQKATIDGFERRPFMTAIEDELEVRLKSYSNKDQLNEPSTTYLARSQYGDQIHALFQYFDPHQLLFIRSEDLKYDTEVTLYQIFQFLSVPFEQVDCTAQNIGFYNESISPTDYNSVLRLVEKDIYQIEELLGWNCNEWLRPLNVRRPMETFFA